MSQDAQLAHRCPHLIMEEVVELGSDGRLLSTRAPVASTTLIRVLANNEYYIPSSGLHSQAYLVGTEAGPFRITGCASSVTGTADDANVVTITTSTESATFRLPLGNRVTVDELIRRFRREFSNLAVDKYNGRLEFLDISSIGKESKVVLTGRGAEAIGFTGQKAAYGQQVYPGWNLYKQEDVYPRVNSQGSVVQPARYVRFVSPPRNNPLLKVTYTAPPDRCPRCRATYIENDWRFNVEGDLVLIGNEDLLYQAALKILLTKKGSNPYHPNYGSSLLSRVGRKAVGGTATLLQEDVRQALALMQTLQSKQGQFQAVTPKERLYSVVSVDVLQHEQDPTVFLVDVVVSNGTGTPVSLSIVFSVPGAVALAGSNGLSLGLDGAGLSGNI